MVVSDGDHSFCRRATLNPRDANVFDGAVFTRANTDDRACWHVLFCKHGASGTLVQFHTRVYDELCVEVDDDVRAHAHAGHRGLTSEPTLTPSVLLGADGEKVVLIPSLVQTPPRSEAFVHDGLQLLVVSSMTENAGEVVIFEADQLPFEQLGVDFRRVPLDCSYANAYQLLFLVRGYHVSREPCFIGSRCRPHFQLITRLRFVFFESTSTEAYVSHGNLASGLHLVACHSATNDVREVAWRQ